jgi:SAM-dependent methyltransferase
MSADRERARLLAADALARGEPTAWFERLYAEAKTGGAVVPWADRVPNPHVVAWLEGRTWPAGARALDVGCGLGDTACELARRGLRVIAFDVSPTAVADARARFDGTAIEFVVADLLAPPPAWHRAFDLVVEVYTLQVLPADARAAAVARLRTVVAPGGTLLVVARGRDDGEHPGAMPWPLTRHEVEAMGGDELALRSFEDFRDDEDPPVRRFRATFVRC